MADSILRLRVQSEEYDSKIKRAAEGIQRLAAKIHDSQGEFEGLDDDQKNFIKNLGYMNTVSQTAVGKVRELEAAYKGLQTMYNGFTAFEKNSEDGKILAEQLSVLRERTLQARSEMESANNSLNTTGGFLEQLQSKFTINIDAMKLFNVGLQAVGGALNVVKDAFFNNEEQLDEWGRIVESSQSLYNGFLSALNTGDVSGYLHNIDNITKAAREAYNALDNLSTFNAFNQVNIEKTRTGMTESIVDYREGKSTKETVRAAGDAYKKELEERRKLEKDAYLKKIAEVAAQRGVSAQDLTTALSGTFGSYQQLKNMPMSGTKTVFYGGGMFGGGGSYEKAIPGSVQEKLGEALRRLNDAELKDLQALGAQAERTANEIAQVDRQLVRVLNGRQGNVGSNGRNGGSNGGNGGIKKTEVEAVSGSIDAQTKKVQELQKAWRAAADDDSRKKIKKEIEDQQYALDRMTGKETFDPSKLGTTGDLKKNSTVNWSGADKLVMPVQLDIKSPIEQWKSEIAELQQAIAEAWTPQEIEVYQERIKELESSISGFTGQTVKGASATAKSWSTAGSAIGQVSGAISGLEDPSAKILATIGQAIATVALAYSESLSQTAEKKNIWAFIAAAAAATISMATTISSIHSATGYARGGIVDGSGGGFVGGTAYSGDNIGNVRLDAGELVLNRSQQSNLAGALENADRGGEYKPSYISGEQIFVAVNRYAKRTGRGELVTWK